jgi:hypothetical protein
MRKKKHTSVGKYKARLESSGKTKQSFEVIWKWQQQLDQNK